MAGQNCCVVHLTQTPQAFLFSDRQKTYTYRRRRYNPYSSSSFQSVFLNKYFYVLQLGNRNWQYYEPAYRPPGHYHMSRRPIYAGDSSNDPLHEWRFYPDRKAQMLIRWSQKHCYQLLLHQWQNFHRETGHNQDTRWLNYKPTY